MPFPLVQVQLLPRPLVKEAMLMETAASSGLSAWMADPWAHRGSALTALVRFEWHEIAKAGDDWRSIDALAYRMRLWHNEPEP